MLALTAFLLVAAIAALGLSQQMGGSPLLALGLLLFIGHILGVMMRRFRIPRAIGYIFAGMIAGPGGIGFTGGALPSSFAIFERCILSLLIADMMRSVIVSDRVRARTNVPLGIAASVLGAVFVMAALWWLPLDIAVKSALVLTAAVFSPLAVYATAPPSTARADTLQIALAGSITALTGGIVCMALTGSGGIAMAVRSLAEGFGAMLVGGVWMLVAVKAAGPRWGEIPAFRATIILLLAVSAAPLGITPLFAAAGAGIVTGIIAPSVEPRTTGREFVVLSAFCIMGTRLPLMDIMMIDLNGWIAVGITVAVMTLARGAVVWHLSRRRADGPPRMRRLAGLLLQGPFVYLIATQHGGAPFPGSGAGGDQAMAITLSVACIMTASFVSAIAWRISDTKTTSMVTGDDSGSSYS